MYALLVSLRDVLVSLRDACSVFKIFAYLLEMCLLVVYYLM